MTDMVTVVFQCCGFSGCITRKMLMEHPAIEQIECSSPSHTAEKKPLRVTTKDIYVALDRGVSTLEVCYPEMPVQQSLGLTK